MISNNEYLAARLFLFSLPLSYLWNLWQRLNLQCDRSILHTSAYFWYPRLTSAYSFLPMTFLAPSLTVHLLVMDSY